MSVFFEKNFTLIVEGNDADTSPRFSTDHLPGNDVGMVFHFRQQNLITLSQLSLDGLRDKVNPFRGPATNSDIFAGMSMDKIADRLPRIFICIGGAGRERMGRSMNVRLIPRVKMCHRIDHTLRLVCCSRIIKPDQGISVDHLM